MSKSYECTEEFIRDLFWGVLDGWEEVASVHYDERRWYNCYLTTFTNGEIFIQGVVNKAKSEMGENEYPDEMFIVERKERVEVYYE